MVKKYTSEVKTILAKHKAGWVFTHADFKKLNNTATIERALSRLVANSEIKRIRRGLYYIPEISRWGEVLPSVSNILKALAKSMNTYFVPDGANALYQLGLTPQVPMKQVYLTDKQISPITIGKMQIEFKKVTPKKLSGAKKGVGHYLSAIEYLGKNEIFQEDVKAKIANIIDKNIAYKLKDASQARARWVQEAVKQITQKVA